MNVGGETQEMAGLLRCTALYFVRQVSQILEVLRDFHCLFGSRNSPTTDILHTLRHVYRRVWPAREAKPRFGAALEHSAHDCKTRLFSPIPVPHSGQQYLWWQVSVPQHPLLQLVTHK